MKSLTQYLHENLYIGTRYNNIPSPQHTGISNNILPYYVDYNVMLYSRGRYLPLTSLFYTARFNGYCVHGDCRETLVKQPGGYDPMSVNDITLCIIDELGRNFNRNVMNGGQSMPGVPYVYPFLTGYNVDFLTRTYELSNNQADSDFDLKKQNWSELAAETAASMFGNSIFPWSGIGEIIYYNPKRRSYEDEVPMYVGKLTPIPEFIQFSQENRHHPLIQIHYWIGDDDAYNDLCSWATRNPKANIILCHGGYEKGDDIKDWLKKIEKLPHNALVEVSWTLLDLLYDNRNWIFDALPPAHYVYGSDATPHAIKDGHDIDLDVDKLVQVSTMLESGAGQVPIEGNSYKPFYKVPNAGDRLPGEQKM